MNLLFETSTGLPSSGALLPDEIAVKFGCVDCTHFDGCHVFQADKERRQVIKNDTLTIAAVADLPVSVMLGGTVTHSEVTCVDDGFCANGEAQALVEEFINDHANVEG